MTTIFYRPDLVGPVLVIASGLLICAVARLFGREWL